MSARRALLALPLLVIAAPARADGWIPVASLPQLRTYAGVAAPPGGTLFIVGGQAGSTIWTTEVQAYNPATDAWTAMTGMPTRRGGFAIATIDTGLCGTVYVIGGTREPDAGLTENAAFYPLTNSWATRASMPTPRRWCAGAALGGTVYVVGGIWSGTITGRMEAYFPATNTWAQRASMPTPRFLHSVVALGGKLYAIGGITALFGGPSGGNVKVEMLDTVEVYDPATNSWAPASPMPTPRGAAGAAVPGNGMIYVAGGMTSAGSTAAVERYDPVADAWIARAPLDLPVGPPDGERHGLVVAAPWSSTILFAAGGETARAGYPDPDSPAGALDATGLWRTSGTIWGDHERYERSPAGLSAVMRVEPPAAEVGRSVTVWLDVTNTGDADVASATAFIEITAGAAALAPDPAPITPASFTTGLEPGEVVTLGWRYDVVAPGLVYLSATLTGVDAEWTGLAPLGAAFNDAAVTCAFPVRLAASLRLSPLPLIAGQTLTVTLTVSNTGGGTVYDLAAEIAAAPPGAPVAIIAGPPLTSTLILSPWLSGTVVILPMSTTTYVWTFSVTGDGYAAFSAEVAGVDPLFGAVSATAMRSTQPSVVRDITGQPGDRTAVIRWTANPAFEAVSGYLVYRRAPGGALVLYATTTGTWFADAGLINGVPWGYVVVAVNADGTGPPSAEATVVPVQIPDIGRDVRVSSSGPNPLYANPDKGEVIRLFVNVPPGSGTLRVAVYTLVGEEVRVLYHDPATPGERILEWDGRNGKGRTVATGGYYLIFEMPDGARIKRKAAIIK